MGWWFGRKSAPADARPFVPAWLNTAIEEEGFARSLDGFSVYLKAENQVACYRAGAWEIGVLRGSSVSIGGVRVVGSQAAAIVSPSGGATVDSQARGTIDQILAALRQHGLIAT